MRVGGKLRYQHRHDMEEFLGRKLRSSEKIHHKNGVRHDNQIENLEIVGRDEHIEIHQRELGALCPSSHSS